MSTDTPNNETQNKNDEPTTYPHAVKVGKDRGTVQLDRLIKPGPAGMNTVSTDDRPTFTETMYQTFRDLTEPIGKVDGRPSKQAKGGALRRVCATFGAAVRTYTTIAGTEDDPLDFTVQGSIDGIPHDYLVRWISHWGSYSEDLAMARQLPGSEYFLVQPRGIFAAYEENETPTVKICAIYTAQEVATILCRLGVRVGSGQPHGHRLWCPGTRDSLSQEIMALTGRILYQGAIKAKRDEEIDVNGAPMKTSTVLDILKHGRSHMLATADCAKPEAEMLARRSLETARGHVDKEGKNYTITELTISGIKVGGALDAEDVEEATEEPPAQEEQEEQTAGTDEPDAEDPPDVLPKTGTDG